MLTDHVNVLAFPLTLVAMLLAPWSTADVVAQSNNLQRLENCQFIEADWCDGDSFRVKNDDGKEFTLRLYGVDCIETRVQDDSDATRLRSQRRYLVFPNLVAALAPRSQPLNEWATMHGNLSLLN